MADTELHSKAHRGGDEEPTQAYSVVRQGERRGDNKDGAKKATWYEPRLQGWDHIAPVLGWTVRTAIRHRLELREHKAIFYQWLGKPPRKTVCSYESLLRLFLVTREDSAAPATSAPAAGCDTAQGDSQGGSG